LMGAGNQWGTMELGNLIEGAQVRNQDCLGALWIDGGGISEAA
jgi:hypothetical protein